MAWKEQLGVKWSTYVDLQLRSVDYSGKGTDEETSCCIR